ncbi:MAG: hypothetical protein MO852_05180 [Candidatus Devosia euplotis]|nr:hypothetical protein [Candidatus Devosia euplotis]
MNKTILTTSIAALMAASALPALAQDAAVGVDAGAGVSVETSAGEAGADAATGVNAMASTDSMADHSYASAMAAVSGAADADLSVIEDQTKVNIVLLPLQDDAAIEGSALDEALSTNADALTALHANVDGNAAIKAELEVEGYSTDDVVAVQIRADGTATVYVDDRD